MSFGDFLSALMKDLGIGATDLAEMTGVGTRTVFNWKAATKTPRTDALVKIADALQIPLATFRAAIDGKASLPSEYRDRTKWRSRRGIAAGSDASEQRTKVWAWFKSAPLAVQHAVLDVVPEGMETEYLRHVTDYFKRRLTAKKKAS